MESRLLLQQNYRRAQWKNGLGYTDEIAIFPPGSDLRRGDFLWRLSTARIEQNSPFSQFPDHDRALVILSGGGVRLFHCFEPGESEERIELPPLSPYDFPGDITSRCELISGPVRDLSVFIRKGEVEAVADVVRLSQEEEWEWLPTGRWNFIFAVEGRLRVQADALLPGDAWQVSLKAPLREDENVAVTAPENATFVTLSLL